MAWLLVLATGRKLTVARTLRPAQPAAGDDLAVTFRVANGSQLPGLQVTLPDATGDLSAGRQTIELASLGPLQERAATSAPQPARRGIHHLPALWAVAEDPLGLVHTRRRLGDPLQVTVYPRLVDLRSCALFADMGTRRDPGRRGFVRLGASEFRGIRPHYPGEPLSHVDWKATAKTGNLMLREMDDPTSGDITVLLDGTAALVVGEDAAQQLRARRASRRLGGRLRPRAPDAASTCCCTTAAGGRLVLRPTSTATAGCSTAWPRRRPTRDRRCPAALQRLRPNGGRLARTQILTLVALSLDRELVRSLPRCAETACESPSSMSMPARSRPGPPTRPPTRSGACSARSRPRACSASRLERGDDLRSALSLSQAQEQPLRADPDERPRASSSTSSSLRRLPSWRRSAIARVARPSIAPLLAWAALAAALAGGPGLIRRRAWPAALVLLPRGGVPDHAGAGTRAGRRPWARRAVRLLPRTATLRSARVGDAHLPPRPHGRGRAQAPPVAGRLRRHGLASLFALSLRKALPAVVVFLVPLGFGLTVDGAGRVILLPLVFLLLAGLPADALALARAQAVGVRPASPPAPPRR